MEHVKQQPAVKRGRLHTAIDSTPQKLVTVRQMFSADPAPGKPGRLSGTSAVSPVSDGGSLALPTGTDESRASISQRFNFFTSYHVPSALSTALSRETGKFVQVVSDFPVPAMDCVV